MKFIIAATIGAAAADRATTTRYWDCSGGACGCGYGTEAAPIFCHSNAMFAAPSGNSYGAKFYGTAAVSKALGGDYWLGQGCGRCYKVTAASNIAGHSETSTVVLKGTNFCPDGNSSCAGGKKHFDIAAPGFDFSGSSISNTCSKVGEE